VTGIYATALIVLALTLAVWAVVLLIVNRPPGAALIGAAAVLELVLVGFAVGGIVQMLGTDREFARAEFVGYLLACVAIVPAAVWWMKDEKTRAASGVLAVVFVVVPILVVRVQQVWAGAGV
jgi:hypothetical protein